jgi:hypothetical protein
LLSFAPTNPLRRFASVLLSSVRRNKR